MTISHLWSTHSTRLQQDTSRSLLESRHIHAWGLNFTDVTSKRGEFILLPLGGDPGAVSRVGRNGAWKDPIDCPGPPRKCQGGTRGNLPYFLGLTEACRVRKIFPYERQPYLLEELNLPLIAITGKKFIFDNYNVEFTRHLESLWRTWI